MKVLPKHRKAIAVIPQSFAWQMNAGCFGCLKENKNEKTNYEVHHHAWSFRTAWLRPYSGG